MKKYFQDFPVVSYTLPNGQQFSAKDLAVRFNVHAVTADDKLSTYLYRLKDHDRPDTIAKDYYGDTNYAWLVLVSGGLTHYLSDFPLTDTQLENHIESTYGISVTTAMSTILHYVDDDGDIVLGTTINPVTIYEYEYHLNESKRYIGLISKEYLPQINTNLDKFFRDL